MSTLRLRTKFFPLAFLLYLFPARVSLDGAEAQKVGWGTTDLQVTPGPHHLLVFFPYMVLRQAGKAEVDVSVAEGQTVAVTYTAPWLVFLKGKTQVA